MYFSPEAVSKLESIEEERCTTSSLLFKALKATANINKETKWEKLGITGMCSPSTGTLALQREWNIWGSSNSSPQSDNIWTYLDPAKLECLLSLLSLSAADHRFLLSASHSQLLGAFEQALYVTTWNVYKSTSGTPAEWLFPRVRAAGWVRRSRSGKMDKENLTEHNAHFFSQLKMADLWTPDAADCQYPEQVCRRTGSFPLPSLLASHISLRQEMRLCGAGQGLFWVKLPIALLWCV